MKEFRWKFK